MIRIVTQYGELDVPEDETIVLTKAIATFQSMVSPSGAFTQNFSIPNTKTNRSVLGFPARPLSQFSQRYEVIDTEIKVNGIQILGFCQIESVSDVIELRFFTGNTTFFQAIKNLNESDIDFSDLDHIWNTTNIQNNLQATSGYVYGLTSSGAFTDNANRIWCNTLLPQVFLHTIITRAMAVVGYSLIGAFWASSEYLSLLVSLTKDKNVRKFITDAENEVDTAYFVALQPSFILNGELSRFLKFPTQVVSTDITTISNVTFFTAPQPSTYIYRCEINIKNNQTNGGFVFRIAAISGAGGALQTSEDFILQPNEQRTIVFETNEIQSNINQTVAFALTNFFVFGGSGFSGILQPTDIEILDGRFIVEDAADQELFFNQTIDIAQNLPGFDIATYFEYLSARFNLIFDVNEFSKEVTAIKFEDIESDPNTEDLTNLIDYTNEPQLEFEYGQYFQRNDLLYSQDETVFIRPVGTDLTFNIDNKKLPFSGVVYEAPFAPSNFREWNSIRLAEILKYASPDNNEPPTVEFRPQPRLLIYRPVTGASLNFGSGTTRNNSTLAFSATNYALPYFFDETESYNLGFTFAQELQPFISALDRCVVVTIDLRLSFLKFVNFDFKTLKYLVINGDNARYFVLEIEQFNLSEPDSTSVKLLKV